MIMALGIWGSFSFCFLNSYIVGTIFVISRKWSSTLTFKDLYELFSFHFKPWRHQSIAIQQMFWSYKTIVILFPLVNLLDNLVIHLREVLLNISGEMETKLISVHPIIANRITDSAMKFLWDFYEQLDIWYVF